MPSMRKYFAACGHKGYGKFCHRCQQAERTKDKKEKAYLRQAQYRTRAAWDAHLWTEGQKAASKMKKPTEDRSEDWLLKKGA